MLKVYGFLALTTIPLALLARTDKTVPADRRVDCHPEPNASKQICESRKCIWDESMKVPEGVPFCYFPQETGLHFVSHSGRTTNLKKLEDPHSPYGRDYDRVSMTTEEKGATLHVVFSSKGSFELPIELQNEPSKSKDSLSVKRLGSSGVFKFQIVRDSTNTAIWDTSLGGLIFADQFIQIAALLGASKIYGFGENIHQTLMHNISRYTTWPMFARDEAPYSVKPDTKNLYGVHAFYLGIEKDNKAHGVLFMNGGAQEVTIGPAPHLIYRAIGGQLDIHFFPGPSPHDVIEQYLALVGRPYLPAYWGLGFQLSRWGYKGLDDMKESVEAVRKAKIPLDVPYADIDYMHRYEDFTIDEKKWKGLPEYIDSLHNDRLHVILIFDPAIVVNGEPFKRAKDQSAKFIEWPSMAEVQTENNKLYAETKDTKIMLGVVWPDSHTAFPDFSNEKTNTWWTNELKRFHDKVSYDGIWIDMNEPASFGTNEDRPWYFFDTDHPNITSLHCNLTSKWESPPYQTWAVYAYGNNHLSEKTLCMVGSSDTGSMYMKKNLYGMEESIATMKALQAVNKKRGAIISRSTFTSSGHYAGHWLGDNFATWDDLRTSIIGIQEFNMFGIPYVGADICGFSWNTSEELCLRWQQLGAFYTFSRNHNIRGASPQHPAVWSSVAQATRRANLFRYYYLPYLYSLMFDASRSGKTVIRPVFFEFPEDEETHSLSFQFMWGHAMMIVPVYEEKAENVSAYLPPSATWYDIRTVAYDQVDETGHVILRSPPDKNIPVFVRGGCIIPRQYPEMTTEESRERPLNLLIAIDQKSGEAKGTFIWDDGESIITNFDTYNYFEFSVTFKAERYSVRLVIERIRSAENVAIPNLSKIDIVAYNYVPELSSFRVNGKEVKLRIELNHRRLFLYRLNLALNASTSYEITWNHTQIATKKTTTTATTVIGSTTPTTTGTIMTTTPTTTATPSAHNTSTEATTITTTTSAASSISITSTETMTTTSVAHSMTNSHLLMVFLCAPLFFLP